LRQRWIVLISAVIIVAIIIAGVIFFVRSPVNPATLELALNPSPPLNINQGEKITLQISLRNSPGFRAVAEGVKGELLLPDGFIEESFQTQTRQLVFGRIDPGESGNFGLTIVASDTIEAGVYQAKLSFWGTNVPKQEVNLEIYVQG
jgi:uncharacterized membrane protein